ncbi:hypothetical protein KUCAC02_037117 [Chaenocephalus aceratus]|nr:hypothetical protein KUCAC02_037117 [Chaenocephalus aceratus]
MAFIVKPWLPVVQLLEYDDVNDTAKATSDLFPPYDLQDFTWAPLNLSGASALLCGAAATFDNGSLCLKLTVFDSEGRDQMLPRLLHSANSSQLEVWLDGLLPRASRSRFLLELQAVGGAYPLSRVEVLQWLPALNRTSQGSVFLQWKPVSYRRSPPSVEEGSPTRSSLPRPQRGEEAFSALITAFYAEPETFGINVSFGISGEPFYGRSRFLSWTVLLGVGTPPMDSFSPMVLIMMAVGLGTPMILLVLGGVCICVRKRASASNYEPIN